MYGPPTASGWNALVDKFAAVRDVVNTARRLRGEEALVLPLTHVCDNDMFTVEMWNGAVDAANELSWWVYGGQDKS